MQMEAIPHEFKKLSMSLPRDISFNDSEPQNSTPGSYRGYLGERLRRVMDTVGVTEADVEGLHVLWPIVLIINLLEVGADD